MRADLHERSGLMAAAQLLIEPRMIEHYFGSEFREHGFFAVVIGIENTSTDTFLLERKDVALVLESGKRFQPVAPFEVVQRARRPAIGIWTALLSPLVFPVVLAHRNAEEYNFAVVRNVERKSFPRTLRLQENDLPVVGAVFFRDPGPRSLEDFDSSVIELVIGVEGSPPTDDEDREEGSRPRVMGRQWTFTISLGRKGIW